MTAKTESSLSPWVTLVERTFDFRDGSRPQVYHALNQADYVTVFAVTTKNSVPLVRQYRPAIEGWSIELPGGILDPNEDPADAARRELAEEVGLECGPLVSLGCFDPDTGRLGNKLWGYFAANATPIAGWEPEPHVSPVERSLNTVLADVGAGRMHHLLHAALIGIAIARRLVPLPAIEDETS
jgi:8-oxo-dGTP pyrophosphatase MutT (NUDIX family)